MLRREEQYVLANVHTQSGELNTSTEKHMVKDRERCKRTCLQNVARAVTAHALPNAVIIVGGDFNMHWPTHSCKSAVNTDVCGFKGMSCAGHVPPREQQSLQAQDRDWIFPN